MQIASTTCAHTMEKNQYGARHVYAMPVHPNKAHTQAPVNHHYTHSKAPAQAPTSIL